MSITLGTVSSPVVDGRCMGCGRFIKRSESHFHSESTSRRKRWRGPPKAHLWWDGGGMVVRCSDPERAARLIQAKYRHEEGVDQETAEMVFPVGQGEVEKGRTLPGRKGADYRWTWWRLDDDASGPGVTTAVVWYD